MEWLKIKQNQAGYESIVSGALRNAKTFSLVLNVEHVHCTPKAITEAARNTPAHTGDCYMLGIAVFHTVQGSAPIGT